jgi:microcin C transport system permease protein
VQGYFGGWTDLLFQRFIEIWSSMPVLYLLLIIAAILPPGFFMLLGIMLLFSWVGFVGIVRAEFLRARNFEYVAPPARSASTTAPSCSAPAAQRHGGDADLPAVHPLRLDHDADLARLPRLRHAARLAVARRTDQAGQVNLQAPWLGLTGFFVMSMMLSLLIFIGEACAMPSIRGRRSDERMTDHPAPSAISPSPSTRAATSLAVDHVSFDIKGRATWWRWSANPARASRSRPTRS